MKKNNNNKWKNKNVASMLARSYFSSVYTDIYVYDEYMNKNINVYMYKHYIYFILFFSQ